MTTAGRLVLMSTPATVTVAAIIVLTTIGVSLYAWRRSHYRRSLGFQESLRVAIVILVAILFNQPEWVQEFRPEERPTVAVFWDDSGSMRTPDALVSGGDGTGPAAGRAVARAEVLAPLTEPEAWQGLRDKYDVLIQPIGAEGGTNLHAPLSGAAGQVKNLVGMVLISDGDWNSGNPPVEAAARLRLKGVPVFTVAVGSPTRLPDVELVDLDLPTFGVKGKAVRVPFTIDSSLPREYLTTVTLKTSAGETLTKDIRVAAMGRTADAISWKPAETGDYTVTVEIPHHGDEAVLENNVRSAPIAIRQEQLKVLVVESFPRWEYRYLRNALSRDPGVDVSCLLFHPGLSKAGGGSKDYIKQFPSGIEELSKYDVVFLGDVGIGNGQLTAEDCRLLKGLVEHQASGLVLMPGWQGRVFDLLETELEELCPVLLDAGQPEGWGSRTPARFELTEQGRRSLLTKLADTPEENVLVWEDLPGFQWHAPVIRAKAGSEVLAVHGEAGNEFGRYPLLATRTFGAGKVLFMGTDGAWRWRKGVEDKYHYRFWGQVVRWMAYQRNMAKGESMRLFHTPDQPRPRQSMTLHAHVAEANGEPLSQGEVVARITAPSGKTETVRLVSTGDEWGVFQGRHEPQEAGEHTLILSCKQTSATLETRFYVQGEELERIGKPARPEVLEEISRVTGGKSVRPQELETLVESLAAMPMPPPAIRRVQLWSHPAVAGLLVLLLGAFWIWRKATGSV